MFKITFLIMLVAKESVNCCNTTTRCTDLKDTEPQRLCKSFKQASINESYYEAFEELARNVTRLDIKTNGICFQNRLFTFGTTSTFKYPEMQELQEISSYKIRKPVGDFTEEELEIKIKQRVLLILGTKLGVHSVPHKYVAEIRVLPTFVDTRKATFTLADGVLEVTIPKKDEMHPCDVGILEEVLKVPVFKLFSGSITRRL